MSALSIVQVSRFLEATFDQNTELRIQAELSLKKLEKEPGFVSILLQLIIDQNTHSFSKQAASIYFKNQISKQWEPTTEDKNIINEDERVFIKAQIVQSILTAPITSRAQLLTALKTILRSDYPEKWANFLSLLSELLNSSDPLVFHAGLSILKELVGCYRWKGPDQRGPLYPIIDHTFGLILNRAMSILHSNDVLAGSICHLVCKIYHNSIEVFILFLINNGKYELSPAQRTNDSLIAWGNLFMGIIEKQLDLSIQSTDPETRQTFSWWKAKKWAYYCVHKLFSKYANPTFYGAKSKYSAFGKIFLEHFVPMILGKYLKQVELYTNGQWFSDATKQQLCLFFAEAVVYKSTWSMMKPYLENLLQHFIFPQLCFTHADRELWESDPAEYIQSKLDPMRDYKSPSSAAKELLSALVKSRNKQTLLPILKFVNQTLQANSGQSFEESCRYDGALSLIISIADLVMAPKSPIYNELQTFITTYIIPKFQSPFAHLRLRACDAMIYFSELEYLPNDLLLLILKSVISCLQDTCLQVKIWGALALRPLLAHDCVRETLKPDVGQVMQILLIIANEVDMDTITDVMESFVDYFSNELVPFAVELGAQLRDTYLRILCESNLELSDNQDYDEISDKMMAASGILKTISTLFLAVDSAHDVLRELEKTILPICIITMEKNLVDLYSEVFDIIDICTFSSKSISAEMWSVFPYIYQSFKTEAIDFLDEMLPSLDNYVTFGSEIIKQNVEFQKMFCDIAFTVFSRPTEAGEQDLVRACQLFEAILLNLRSTIDAYIPNIIAVILPFTLPKAAKTVSFQVHSLEVIINCILYNPILTLSILEQHNYTQQFLSTWLNNLNDFIRVHDIRLSVCTLSSLLEVPELEQMYPSFIVGILQLLKEFPEALKERERIGKMMKGEGSEPDEEDDFDFGDEKDDDLEDGGIEVSLNDELAELAGASSGYEQDDNDDDESDDYNYGACTMEEDPFFETILDTIDIVDRVKVVLTKMNPTMQNAILLGLNEEQQQQLHKILV